MSLLTIVATAVLSLLYKIGCVVLRLMAPPLKSALPYTFTGSGLNTKGCEGGTAPALKLPEPLITPITVLFVLSPVPVGSDQEEPVLVIKPISLFGNVVNVDPSNAAAQPSWMSEFPEPVILLTCHTAFTTDCFCAALKGVPSIKPFTVMPSNVLTAKSLLMEGVIVIGK